MKSKIILGLLIIAIGLTLIPFMIDKSSIEDLIVKQYSGEYKQIVINKSVSFNDKMIVIFTADHQIGKGVFDKNIFGQYKMNNIGIGSDRLFRHSIQMIDDIPYLIIGGKNNDENDNAITRIMGNSLDDNIQKEFEIKYKIPKDDYFIVIEELDKDYRYGFLPMETNFYNINGENRSGLMKNQ